MLAPGQAVRVRDDWPELRGPCHIRTPHYLRGRQGTVVRHLGDFPNPEDLAFARPAARLPLYHVAFPPQAIWPDAGGNEILVELYEPWLEPAWTDLLDAPAPHLLAAIRGLLAAKGIATPDEIAERVTLTDQAGPARGAAMVARAWTDPAYRELLLRDGAQAAEAMGIPMRGLPPLGVLENLDGLHHLVVCTLCSCYPRGVLGYPPFWFKSPGYRARAVRDPRGVLAEWGTSLPDSAQIRVVDSTADYRWMVLPQRPAGTDGWDADRLAALVREGDMIGVTVPTA